MSVRRSLSALALALVALLTPGCQESTATDTGTMPASDNPVGPLPGPGKITPRDNPYKHDEAALVRGRQLFVSFNCSGCHGGHGGGGMGPSLRDKVWLYGSSGGDIFDSIANGRGKGMPAWGTRLPAESIWQITTYIQSLRTDREPDPPPRVPR